MKKTLFLFFAMVLAVCCSVTNAQTLPTCKLKANFDFKTDNCFAKFADLSAAGTGTTITDWYWDFGDATTSTLQNPTHTFAASGTYTVCLTIVGVNALGVKCRDKFCLPVTIRGCGQTLSCGVKPLFDFKVDKCTVYFVDQSGTNPGTVITNWYWNFGDGNTSTAQHPTHSYATAGTYSVCLITVAVNAAGERCKNEYCFPVKVENCGQTLPCGVKPLFDFKIDKCTVYFVDQSGTNPGTAITNWYWSFGDGNTSTLQSPVHTYAAAGTYKVCLITVAVNAQGEQCRNEYCREIKVEGCGDPVPCKVGAKFDFKTDKCTVYFTDYSGAGTGTVITNWYWDFGDGNTSTLQNPVHTYATAGAYVACLVVVGTSSTGEQCKDKICLDVKVKGCSEPQPCKVAAKFDYKTDKCTVYFADYSGAGTGTVITNWYWDFGDGTTSTLQNPVHTYASDGTYLVCLVIVGINNTTGEQCKDRLCLEVKIDGCGKPQPCKVAAKFDYKVDGCAVYFTDHSGTAGGTTITYWEWSFGDGSFAYTQHPTHIYSSPGTYFACLIIVGTNPATGEQCKDKVCLEVIVKDCDPTAKCLVYPKFDFKADRCNVYFTDYSGSGAGTTITDWHWSFGDGTISTTQHPSHTYTTSGTYEVCLTVKGKTASGGECKEVYCQKVEVKCLVKPAGTVSKRADLTVYPNPAQSLVNIQFKLETAGQVNITLTDIQGRVLSTIQDGNMSAGFHNVSWNVDVKSGLYLITIRTAEGMEQKQVLIQQ